MPWSPERSIARGVGGSAELRAHVDSTGSAVFPRVLSWICPVPPHIVESPPEHTMNGRLGRFDKTGSQLCGFVRTRSGQPH